MYTLKFTRRLVIQNNCMPQATTKTFFREIKKTRYGHSKKEQQTPKKT